MVKCLLFINLLLSFAAFGEQIYQTPDDFIRNHLNQIPKPSVLWIDTDLNQTIEQIMAHSYKKLRIKYWRHNTRSVWILDEIGKESPITVGVAIENNQVKTVNVLVYRESRGDEVRHSFFTDQFKSARLSDNLQLDKHIDGITGATLSVRALNKVTRLALYLHQKVNN